MSSFNVCNKTTQLTSKHFQLIQIDTIKKIHLQTLKESC